MKKVLHIVESFGSGVFSFLVDLINSTDKDFEIIVAHGIRTETLDNFKEYFSDRVKFIKVKNFTRNISLTKDFAALLEVKKIIKNEKPDIIHLHSSKAGIIGRFATNGKKTKMFYNPHGFSFLMKNCSKIKRTIYWCIEKIGALRKCTIVGCSAGEYEEALKLNKNSICINNGINIEKIKKETRNFSKYKPDFSNLRICTSGRIGFQKNPEMFDKIAKSFPNMKFTWIGDGDLKEKLTSKNIEVTGWKTREEALKIVNEHDIFILTSLWEGLPISLLEAMFLKKLCIVTDVIGNRDVIEQEKNGFVIKENYKDIIQNISEESYKYLSENAQQSVLKKFNSELMVKEYVKEYLK